MHIRKAMFSLVNEFAVSLFWQMLCQEGFEVAPSSLAFSAAEPKIEASPPSYIDFALI